MNKLFVIFFVAFSAPAILSYKIQVNDEFQKELSEISKLLEGNFNNIEDLKLHIAKGIEDMKEDSYVDSNFKAQLERIYEMLNTVNGPEDLEKLKEVKKEIYKLLDIVEAAISSMFEKFVPELPKIEDVMQEFLKAIYIENTNTNTNN